MHNLGGRGTNMPHTNTAQLLTLQQYTRQLYTIDTHGRGEGRSNTPTSWCRCAPTSSPQSKRTSTPAKRKWIPSLHLGKTSRSPTTQATSWKEGGGDSLTLRGCLCGACVRRLAPPPPDILCCVCFVVHMPMPKFVCVRGGRAHMPIHVSSVLDLLVYVYYPSTPPPLWCPLEAIHA